MDESVKAYVKAVEKRVREGTFVRMDETLKRELQRLAEADGRTLSGLIHKIVADWVKARAEKK